MDYKIHLKYILKILGYIQQSKVNSHNSVDKDDKNLTIAVYIKIFISVHLWHFNKSHSKNKHRNILDNI